MQGHGAKYPCAWCYATAPFIEDAPLRTLGQLRKLQEQFNSEEGGRGDKKYAMEFFNVINMDKSLAGCYCFFLYQIICRHHFATTEVLLVAIIQMWSLQ